MATTPKPGEGSRASKIVRSVQVSPNVTVKAPYKGPAFTPEEIKRLKSIVEITKPTSKKTAKVNAKALKASGKVKPRTDTKFSRRDALGKQTLTARELAREAAAARKGGRGMGGGAGLGIGKTR
jgi:hypothetical protein